LRRSPSSSAIASETVVHDVFCRLFVSPSLRPELRRGQLRRLADQRQAARRLDMSRTTLAYQEMQIRKLLRKFVLEQDP